MSELRNYILSKLQEMADQTPAKNQPKPVARRKPASKSAEAAKKAANKSKFSDIFARISAGVGAPAPKQNSSTDLRTQLAYTLADKLEELKQSTVDSAAAKRVAQVRSKDFRGQEKPVFKGGTGGTDKPEQIGTRSGAGKGVIGKRLSTLYKDKTTKGVATRKQESTNLKDRMVEILMEMRGDASARALAGARKAYADLSAKTGKETTHNAFEARPVPERGSNAAKHLADKVKTAKSVAKDGPYSDGVSKKNKEIRAHREKHPIVYPKTTSQSGGHKTRRPKTTPSGSYIKHRSGKDVEV